MPTATFAAEGLATLRGVPAPDQTNNYQGAYNVGVYDLGGVKAILERPVMRFDVFGPALDGRPLNAGDVLLDAALVRNVFNLPGLGAQACAIDRITRPSWDYLTTTWINWATANAWTTVGGDIAAPQVAYTGPAALGDHTIAGMLPIVSDAIASRAGIVLVRDRLVNEAALGTTRYYSAFGLGNPATGPRLIVTYEGQEPSPIDHPAHTMAGSARPPARGAQPDAALAPAAPAAPARGERTHGR